LNQRSRPEGKGARARVVMTNSEDRKEVDDENLNGDEKLYGVDSQNDKETSQYELTLISAWLTTEGSARLISSRKIPTSFQGLMRRVRRNRSCLGPLGNSHRNKMLT
jgi:hypothetical protein